MSGIGGWFRQLGYRLRAGMQRFMTGRYGTDTLNMTLLGVGVVICHLDYSVVWRYFSWSNQTLAMIALWTAAVYLARKHKNYWICALPATFMSAVSMTYFVAAPECLGLLWIPMGLAYSVYYPIAVVVGVGFVVLFLGIFLKSTKSTTLAK